MQVDFGKTADDYGTHRAGFPAALFERLIALGIGRPGQRIVDLGTGTGSLARGFAQQGAVVTGLDIAPEMMAQAAKLDAAAGVSVTYREAPAEHTGLPEDSFDVVSAGQCWHWFDAAAAGREVRRLLVPGGRLLIAHFDWIPLPGNLVAASEALIERHNPDWTMGGGNGLHAGDITDAALAGFLDLEVFGFDHPIQYSHEAWRGRIRASAGIAASLSQDAVAAFDTEHAAMLARDFPEDPLTALHRVFAVIGRNP